VIIELNAKPKQNDVAMARSISVEFFIVSEFILTGLVHSEVNRGRTIWLLEKCESGMEKGAEKIIDISAVVK
jgi:hypothetical protein